MEVNAATGAVRFRTVNKADEGSYTCTASNNVGNTSANGFIKVLGAYRGTACVSNYVKWCLTSHSAYYRPFRGRSMPCAMCCVISANCHVTEVMQIASKARNIPFVFLWFTFWYRKSAL